ncbi:MAG: acetylglutamate kinase [Desulfobacterales bacterium]|nr:acetylglutamate kinase [Desulfobacterales bacterium]
MNVANILTEALPYIQKFHGMTIVIKYGGHAMIDEKLKNDFARDITLMKFVGMNPVIIHGGGPQINTVLDKMGVKSDFVRGMRVTDSETMDVVEMVLGGQINKSIVTQINKEGGKAVGLTGKDGNLIIAKQLNVELGLVGEVVRINPQIIHSLTRDGFIPVIAPIGRGYAFEPFNINADIVASKIAIALSAGRLILLTDVDGIYDAKKSLLSSIDIETISHLIEQKIIKDGMIPKVDCAIDAIRNGVKKAHIINGSKSHALLLELFTDKGVGTEVSL